MTKLNGLLDTITTAIAKIEYYPTMPSQLLANDVKKRRILPKLAKAEQLLKKVSEKNKQIVVQRIADLKTSLDLQVASAIWNCAVKLQNEYDEKLQKEESVSLYELETLADLFQKAADAYEPLFLSDNEKEAIFENLAKIKEQFADRLVDEFKQKQEVLNQPIIRKRKLSNDWLFDRAFLVYQEAIHSYRSYSQYSANHGSKIQKISLSCLNIVYEQHQMGTISQEGYLEKLTHFIGRFSLKTLNWDEENQEEFNWYVRELEKAQREKKANPASFFIGKKLRLEESAQSPIVSQIVQ